MTVRPDPSFHASPKLAMEAPPENFAYTLLLSPDFSKPDALAVIDVKPGSPTFSQIVHTVTMPYKGFLNTAGHVVNKYCNQWLIATGSCL
jgi:selenium-binding protein 1